MELRPIVFPVAGPADYSDTFGACRDGCTRRHQGVDIFAPKLTPLIAAADGRIVSERRNATKKAGNKLVIEDADGWRYVYVHLNNDTPGTDDNANPQSWIAAGDLRAGDMVRAGQVIGYLGDSGNAEETPPHLHFEIIPPGMSLGEPDTIRHRRPTVEADVVVGGDGVVVGRATSARRGSRWSRRAYEDLAGRSPNRRRARLLDEPARPGARYRGRPDRRSGDGRPLPGAGRDGVASVRGDVRSVAE